MKGKPGGRVKKTSGQGCPPAKYWAGRVNLRQMAAMTNVLGSDERRISPSATHPIIPYNWGRYSSRIYESSAYKRCKRYIIPNDGQSADDPPLRASGNPSHYDRLVCS